MTLFVHGDFTSHSGRRLPFKIDCDALTDADLDALARRFSSRRSYSKAVGIPTGGDRFAAILQRYAWDRDHHPLLIVDDVLTTGASMETARRDRGNEPVIGIVIFARGPCKNWITPLFVENL
jgi:orotate phosphoribosyltransferase